jgi:hypothetical protein
MFLLSSRLRCAAWSTLLLLGFSTDKSKQNVFYRTNGKTIIRLSQWMSCPSSKLSFINRSQMQVMAGRG